MKILQKYHQSWLRFDLLFTVALLCIAVIAWTESGMHVNQQLAQAVELARDRAEHDAADIALGLQRNLSLLRGIPSTVAHTRQVADALEARNPYLQSQAGVALNRLLGNAVADLNAVSVLWVMDLQGTCIAASNADKAESFVGTRYADRDYFKSAAQGLAGQQFAIGKKTGIPGLFFSTPVLRNEKVVGVMAVKVDLPFLSLWLSQANAFVTDEYGVVIMATDHRLMLQAFDAARLQNLSVEQSMQRYHLGRVPALDIRKKARPGFADMLLVDQQPAPVLHTQHSVSGDQQLLVHVIEPVPYELHMDTDRVTRFALETGVGVLVLLLVSTAALYVRHIQRTRDALKVHKSRLDEAQLLARVGSWELQRADGAMTWSAQVHRIFHTDPAHTTPSLTAFLERIQEADRPALRKILQDKPDAQAHAEYSVGLARADSPLGRARLKLQAVVGNNGAIEGFLGTLRDTTEQEMLESELRRAKADAESANRLKSDFLANISHELRTPMNTILGMSHIALQGELSPAQKSSIQTVHRSATRLLSLINEILDYTRMEAGKYTLEPRAFPLREVARKLMDQMLPLAEEKGLTLQLDMSPHLPARLLGDAHQLGKVLQALTMNAIKFTQQGRITVGMEMASKTQSVNELHFWVQDTGIGMTTDQQAQLFQAFNQADSSRTRKTGGTGLGLVISQRIVDLMGGRIWMQSNFGTGTTAHFTVPFEKIAQTLPTPLRAGAGTDATAAHSPQQLAGAHILVVEDNLVNQELVRMVLNKLGIAVTLAAHGQEAITLLKTRSDFDAILMDCHMPVMDGYTATQEIRRIEALNAIPVIALTANVSTQDLQKIDDCGMCDVVAKPYTAQELLNALMRWVKPNIRNSAHLSEPEPEPAPVSAQALPPLAGIDVQHGLSIAMSDLALYKKLLRMFAQSEANFVDRFQSAWHTGDMTHTARLAHSLRGASASIGARAVQAAALELESACRKGLTDADIRPLLQHTLEALQVVMDGLRGLDASEAAGEANTVDKERVRALISRLAALLAQQDLSAYDLAEELAMATRNSALSDLVNKVLTAIDRFDLDGAQQVLVQVSAALEGL